MKRIFVSSRDSWSSHETWLLSMLNWIEERTPNWVLFCCRLSNSGIIKNGLIFFLLRGRDSSESLSTAFFFCSSAFDVFYICLNYLWVQGLFTKMTFFDRNYFTQPPSIGCLDRPDFLNRSSNSSCKKCWKIKGQISDTFHSLERNSKNNGISPRGQKYNFTPQQTKR
jgi:hypothetical protein